MAPQPTLAFLLCTVGFYQELFDKAAVIRDSDHTLSVRTLPAGFAWSSALRCQEPSAVDSVLRRYCLGNARIATFETKSGILVRGLQATKDLKRGDVIAEVKLDPAISTPFRLGNDPWYAELAARLLAVADGKLPVEEDVTRRFAQDLFESFAGAPPKPANRARAPN
jgi:hypothetical protein